MNGLETISLLMAAYFAVFAEASTSGLRSLLGAQLDLLPALAIIAASDIGFALALSLSSPWAGAIANVARHTRALASIFL